MNFTSFSSKSNTLFAPSLDSISFLYPGIGVTSLENVLIEMISEGSSFVPCKYSSLTKVHDAEHLQISLKFNNF